MTLIECFTQSHIDNIAACLRLRPEKLVMVGNQDEMTEPIKRYRKLLDQRGLHTQIVMRNVRGKDLGDICAVLSRLVREEPECVIDLTGGDEPVIMAIGAVLAGLDIAARQQIRVEKFDYDTDAVLDCINDNRRMPYSPVKLTVKELVELHGGELHTDAYQPPKDCTYQDIENLWRIVSEAPKDWNQAISYLGEFESKSDSKMQIHLPMEKVSGINNFARKETVVRQLLDRLHRACVIHDQSSGESFKYTYKSKLLRHCTRKAGNILEVKTLLEGRAVQENKVPFFHDCQMSVSIDWNGDDRTSDQQDTRNEIDVVLMHGLTPIFISCKNGSIEDEELYKLHTVAERFGGPHARKMLIATELDPQKPAANHAFSQRAKDMEICLEEKAAKLSREEWGRMLKKAARQGD